MGPTEWIAGAAFVFSIVALVRQELFQRQQSKRANTYAVFELWNSETVRTARTKLWSHYINNPDIRDVLSYQNNEDLCKSLNIISHFYLEAAILYNMSYFDKKAFKAVLLEPTQGWALFFRNLAPNQGDGTINFSNVERAIDSILK